MTWLARATLSNDDVAAHRLLDSYAWHQASWLCFPSMPEANRDFLLRLDWQTGGCRVYLLSRHKPLRPAWCPASGWATKEIAPSFLEHECYRFDLLANPTRKLVVRNATGARRKNGQRVPLLHEDEQRLWLDAKGRQHGFRVDQDASLAIDPAGRNRFPYQGRFCLHVGVRFRGILHVTNRDTFIKAFHKGIGSAKSFGFGMMILQPVM